MRSGRRLFGMSGILPLKMKASGRTCQRLRPNIWERKKRIENEERSST